MNCNGVTPRLQPRRPRLERFAARKGGDLEDVRLDGAVGRRRAVKAVAQHKLAQLGECHGRGKVVVELGAVDARARAKAAPRLLFALDLVLGARLDVVDGMVRPAPKVAENLKLPSAALVPEELPSDALNRAAREVVEFVRHVVREPARLGLVPVVAAHVVDKGCGFFGVVVAKVGAQNFVRVAAHRLPVARRLHELRKKPVRAGAHLARALDNGGRVRVEDARVDLDKAGRVAILQPRAVR